MEQKTGERPPVFPASMLGRDNLTLLKQLKLRIRLRKLIKENINHQPSEKKFALGDTVKVIGCTALTHSLGIGQVGWIGQIDKEGYCNVCVSYPLDHWQWVDPSDLEFWEE